MAASALHLRLLPSPPPAGVKLQQRQLRSVSPAGPSIYFTLLLLLLPSRRIPVRFRLCERERERRSAEPLLTGLLCFCPVCHTSRTQYAARHGAAPRLGRVESIERSGKPLSSVFRRLAGLPSDYNARGLEHKRIRVCICVSHAYEFSVSHLCHLETNGTSISQLDELTFLIRD